MSLAKISGLQRGPDQRLFFVALAQQQNALRTQGGLGSELRSKTEGAPLTSACSESDGPPAQGVLRGSRHLRLQWLRPHLTSNDQIISKSSGRGGRCICSTSLQRHDRTGREARAHHGPARACDIYCVDQSLLGWKYEKAFEESQKYKEGKFILEKTKLKLHTACTGRAGTSARLTRPRPRRRPRGPGTSAPTTPS